MPTPRLRTGLFNKIVPPEGASKEELRVCSTSQVSQSLLTSAEQLNEMLEIFLFFKQLIDFSSII